jgi:hypothetical protein
MVTNLVLMHVTGADGTDELSCLALPQREGRENVPACGVAAYRQETCFRAGMGEVREDPQLAAQHELDLVEAQAVLGALVSVPGIPIEGGYRLEHE